MNKRPIISIALIGALSVALASCGSPPNKIAKPSPTSTTTVKLTDAVSAGGDLFIPQMAHPMPTVALGEGPAQFGQTYTQEAFAYGFGFVYRVNNFPDLFRPNLAKDQTFIPILKMDYESLSSYFFGSLQKEYLDAIPSLVKPLMNDADSSSYNATATYWNDLMMIPDRLSDGSLPLPAKGGMQNVAPWNFGVSVGPPVSGVENLKDYGPTLWLRFKYTTNLAVGDATGGTGILPFTRDITLWMIANPDAKQKKNYPYVIVKWAHGASLIGSETPYSFTIGSVGTSK